MRSQSGDSDGEGQNLNILPPVVLVPKTPPQKIEAEEQMKRDIQELPPFEINDKNNNIWAFLTNDLLKLDRFSPRKDKFQFKISSICQFENQHKKNEKFYQTERKRGISMNKNQILFSHKVYKEPMYDVYIRHDQKEKNQNTKIVSSSNVRQENETQNRARCQSTEGLLFGVASEKQRFLKNLYAEVQMHKRKRMANLILDNLKKSNAPKGLFQNKNIQNSKNLSLLKKAYVEQQKIQQQNQDSNDLKNLQDTSFNFYDKGNIKYTQESVQESLSTPKPLNLVVPIKQQKMAQQQIPKLKFKPKTFIYRQLLHLRNIELKDLSKGFKRSTTSLQILKPNQSDLQNLVSTLSNQDYHERRLSNLKLEPLKQPQHPRFTSLSNIKSIYFDGSITERFIKIKKNYIKL